ncbi:MAG: hypothetical protein OEZ02_07170 [Anaerolineae bacterium]|nr:hypothetical protein [Anaerolineae bacterium]
MQTEREPFEWLLFYAQWVVANTLAWVAGWAVIRYVLQMPADESGMIMYGYFVVPFIGIGKSLLLGSLKKDYGSSKFPILISEWGVIYFFTYKILFYGWFIFIMAGILFHLEYEFDFILGFYFLVHEIVIQKYFKRGKYDSKYLWKYEELIVVIIIVLGIALFIAPFIIKYPIISRWENNDIFLLTSIAGILGEGISGAALVLMLAKNPNTALDKQDLEVGINKSINKPSVWSKLVSITLGLVLISPYLVSGDYGFFGIGIRPCGWLDEIFEISGCRDRWLGHNGIEFIELSDDGDFLAKYRNYRNSVDVFDTGTGELVSQWAKFGWAPRGDLLSIEFAPLDKEIFVIGDRRGDVSLWNYVSGEIIPLKGDDAYDDIYNLIFLPGDKLLVSDSDLRAVLFWNLDTLSAIQELPILEDEGKLIGLSYRADGDLLVAITDQGKLIFWTVDDLGGNRWVEEHIKMKPYKSFWVKAVLDKYGSPVIVGLAENGFWMQREDQDIRLDVDMSKVNYPRKSNLLFSPSGEFVIFGNDDLIWVWRTSDGELVKQIDLCRWCLGSSVRVIGLSLSRNGTLAVALEDEIQIWDIPQLSSK